MPSQNPSSVACHLPFLVHLILYFFQVDPFIQLDLRLGHIAGRAQRLGSQNPSHPNQTMTGTSFAENQRLGSSFFSQRANLMDYKSRAHEIRKAFQER